MISEYAYYDRHSKSRYNRIAIDGTVVGCSRCVGYCKYDMHPGFLTEKMRKAHHCIEKGCNYYLQKDKYIKQSPISIKDYTKEIELSALEQTAAFEGMRVMRVVQNNDYGYSIHYITITNQYSLDECSKNLSKQYNSNISFKRLNFDFDICAQLIMAG